MERILELKDLQVDLLTEKGIGKAVRGMNLTLDKGEIHGIVGESGCGKTVTAKSILRLHDEKKTEYRGCILYGDQKTSLLELTEKSMNRYRGKEIAYVPQNPMTSFDNLYTIGEQIAETMRQHLKLSAKDAWARTLVLLTQVGVTPAEKRALQYPYEFSGGMLQRTMIALAVSCHPGILIADEATTALDVTMQARVLKLLKRLRDETGMSILCITHNFGVVAEICDRVTVMYGGTVVESGSVSDIFNSSKHPYTETLIRNILKSGERKEQLLTIPGNPPEITDFMEGCPYAARCFYAGDVCFKTAPAPKEAGAGHVFSCHMK